MPAKRAIELDPFECIEVASVLRSEAARVREEARTVPVRQRRRVISEGYADRLRAIAEKFDE